MTKRGFTLVELLVVTGIIASMATIGISSYGAIKRGMANRGALAAATSVISLAQNRARIDMSPTVVYFMNELVQAADANVGTVQRYAGVAIAIRRAGRVTRYSNGLLYDEYGGLENIYPSVERESDISDKDAGFRLYRFNLNRMEYSIAKSSVVRGVIRNNQDDDWCVSKPKNTAQVDNDTEEMDGDTSAYAFALKDVNGANWGVGEAYAYEFARIRLADNYVFGTGGNLPDATTPVKFVKAMPFYPDADARKGLETIAVSTLRTDGSYKSIGNTERTLKDI